MVVLVDIGNTNIVISVNDGDSFLDSFRIYSDQKKTGDEYFVIFQTLLRQSGLDFSSVDRVVLSSVVPNLTRAVAKILKRLFNTEPLIVTHDIEAGLNKSSIPQELGSDILSNLACAHNKYPDRCVLTMDFGTALTFSVVDEKGNVVGVAIAPGLITAVNSLFGNTAQLPQVELKIPDSSLGRNSCDSIRSGIMYGYAGLADAMIRKMEAELNVHLFVIATGGLSKTISPLIPRIDELDGLHTLKGLKLISDLNQKSF